MSDDKQASHSNGPPNLGPQTKWPQSPSSSNNGPPRENWRYRNSNSRKYSNDHHRLQANANGHNFPMNSPQNSARPMANGQHFQRHAFNENHGYAHRPPPTGVERDVQHLLSDSDSRTESDRFTCIKTFKRAEEFPSNNPLIPGPSGNVNPNMVPLNHAHYLNQNAPVNGTNLNGTTFYPPLPPPLMSNFYGPYATAAMLQAATMSNGQLANGSGQAYNFQSPPFQTPNNPFQLPQHQHPYLNGQQKVSAGGNEPRSSDGKSKQGAGGLLAAGCPPVDLPRLVQLHKQSHELANGLDKLSLNDRNSTLSSSSSSMGTMAAQSSAASTSSANSQQACPPRFVQQSSSRQQYRGNSTSDNAIRSNATRTGGTRANDRRQESQRNPLREDHFDRTYGLNESLVNSLNFFQDSYIVTVMDYFLSLLMDPDVETVEMNNILTAKHGPRAINCVHVVIKLYFDHLEKQLKRVENGHYSLENNTPLIDSSVFVYGDLLVCGCSRLR